MTHATNGEAMPSIANLMAIHNTAEEALNASNAAHDTAELDRHFRETIRRLQDPGLECRTPADALAVLHYVMEACGEDDVLVDALLPLLIQWLEGVSRKHGIADRAIHADTVARARKDAQAFLSGAYADFKERNGLARIERDTPEWFRMMEATKSQYGSLQQARRDERNAKRRLDTVLRLYREACGYGLSAGDADLEIE